MKQLLLILVLTVVLSNACIFQSLLGITHNPHDGFQELQEQQDLLLTQSTANQSLDMYWNSIVRSKYKLGQMPPTAGSGLGLLNVQAQLQFTLSDMNVPITRIEDTMPYGRIKWIHPLGSCGKVKFVFNDAAKQYTGLFKGADYGIARFSLAADPAAEGFTPGMALKFFRNNQISGNIITMYQIDGQGDNVNFFQNTFTNIVPTPSAYKLQLLAFLTFKRASKCATVLALGDFAHYQQDGQYNNFNYPNQMYFQPVAETQFSPQKNGRDFRDDLSKLKAGQRLYQVYVSQATNGQKVLVGELIAQSEFVASDYCDTQLFFKHQWGEDINCGK